MAGRVDWSVGDDPGAGLAVDAAGAERQLVAGGAQHISGDGAERQDRVLTEEEVRPDPSGVAAWMAARMASVIAMAGMARRVSTPAVTPRAMANAA